MTVEYTSEQVLALAPDDSSRKSGQELANTRKWQSLAMGTGALWGECQGSGAKPYQVRVDLNGPAFKCSCPSRKQPCKHGIGLLLLHSLSRISFREAEQPTWVKEWLDARQQRSQRKEKQEENRTPEQLEEAKLAKEKRRQNRMSSVAAGVDELELFLCDLIRQGVGQLKKESYSFFEARAARLVDAQAPGLARLVRECASLSSAPGNWQEAFLNRLATIFMITSSFKNLETLPPDMEADLLTAIGFTQSQDALLGEEGISDHWFVIAQTVHTEDKLRVQRSWLIGAQSKRKALVLSFAHGTAPFDVLLVPGHCYDAELVFYPSRYPLRALIKSKTTESSSFLPSGILWIEAALGQFAEALSNIPWLEEMPLLLSDQTLIPAGRESSSATMFLTDQNGAALPLATRGSTAWQLLAFSSGKPISIFGEFDGLGLTPLAAINHASGRYLRLATGET